VHTGKEGVKMITVKCKKLTLIWEDVAALRILKKVNYIDIGFLDDGTRYYRVEDFEIDASVLTEEVLLALTKNFDQGPAFFQNDKGELELELDPMYV
jgi:hypothetical protein